MKKALLIGLIAISSQATHAQNLNTETTTSASQESPRFDLSISKPFSLGRNYMHDYFSGIADVGLKYNISNRERVKFGIMLNTSYFRSNSDFNMPAIIFENSGDTIYRTLSGANTFVVNPKFILEWSLNDKWSFNTGLGVAFKGDRFAIDKSTIDGTVALPPNRQTGATFDFGIKYSISPSFYLFANYTGISYIGTRNFIMYNDNGRYGTNSTANTVRVGIGWRF